MSCGVPCKMEYTDLNYGKPLMPFKTFHLKDKPVTKTVDGGRNYLAFSDLDTTGVYMVCIQSQGLSQHQLGPKSCIRGKSASTRKFEEHSHHYWLRAQTLLGTD